MGMYNEVFAPCPYCGGRGYAQIGQIVWGFGKFNLDDPQSLAEELDVDQLQTLHDYLIDEAFDCQNKECGRVFYPIASNKNMSKRLDKARELFGL